MLSVRILIFTGVPVGTIARRGPRILFHAHLALSIIGSEQKVTPDVKDAQMTCTTTNLVKMRANFVLRAQFHFTLCILREVCSTTSLPKRKWIQVRSGQPLANALVNIANGGQELVHAYANLDMNGMI